MDILLVAFRTATCTELGDTAIPRLITKLQLVVKYVELLKFL